MKNNMLKFETKLNIEKCRKIVDERTTNSLLALGCYGRIKENNRICLLCRTKEARSLPLRAFYGKLYDNGGMTNIEGKFRLNSTAKSLLVFWNIFAVGIFLYIVFGLMTGAFSFSSGKSSIITCMIMILLFLLFEFLIMHFGKRININSEKKVAEFLENELKAKQIK